MLSASAQQSSWVCLQAGVWVHRDADGRPTGVIHEVWRVGFEGRLVDGTPLGVFGDLVAAQAALSRAAVEAVASS